MLRILNEFVSDRRGTLAMVFAGGAALAVGLVGMGVDYSRVLSAKYAAQRAADAAALAAANASHLSDATRQSMAQNIFSSNSQNNTHAKNATPIVTVDGEFVTVTSNFSVATTFARVANIDSFDLNISAKARNPTRHVACILALSASSSDAFVVKGTTQLSAVNCAVQANSNHVTSIVGTGSAIATADKFCAKGDISGAQHFTPMPQTGCGRLSDPLANLTAPGHASCPPGSQPQKVQQGSHTLSPGLYCGGLKVMANAQATFDPGVYVIKDGGLTFRSGSVSSGNGVFFYFVGNDTKLDVDGGASIDFKAPAAGIYAGVLFSQDPASGAGLTSNITGGGNVKIAGTLHFPTQLLAIDGNGNLGQSSNAWSIIADKIEIKGNGQVRVEANFTSAGLPRYSLPIIGAEGVKLTN